MVLRQKPFHARDGQHGTQERRRHTAVEQAVAVLGERRGVPYRIVDTESDEPAKQQVKVQPLHQLTFGAHRVEGLQQHRAQQLLRRDRGAADLRVDLAKATVECG